MSWRSRGALSQVKRCARSRKFLSFCLVSPPFPTFNLSHPRPPRLLLQFVVRWQARGKSFTAHNVVNLTPVSSRHDFYESGDGTKVVISIYDRGAVKDQVKVSFEARAVNRPPIGFWSVAYRSAPAVLREWRIKASSRTAQG